MQATLQLIDDYIRQLPLDKSPVKLYEPIRYTMSLGGKRLRPLFCLMAARIWTDSITPLIPTAVGIEVFHNFTLLHDDLMDNANMRRGQSTVHHRWDANTAVLSGDAMFALAMQLMQKNKHLPIFLKATIEVCEGQQFDMDFEQRTDVSESEYLDMIRLKTSVLLAAALQIGALSGGASQQDAARLYDFGIATGLAFQLRDDYLDVYGDAETFGKQIGGDIVANKKTWLLVKALELADSSQRKDLQHWLDRSDAPRHKKIEAVTNLYDCLNIPYLLEAKIAAYAEQATRLLREISVPFGREQHHTALQDLADSLLQRTT